MKLDLLEARQFFADFFYGEHHLPSKIKPVGDGWMVVMDGELATNDFNDMTRLVLMAHQRGIRVCVKPYAFRYLKLILHKREPGNKHLSLGHPTIEEAIANHKLHLGLKGDLYKVNPGHEQYVLWQPKLRKKRKES